MPDPAYTAHAVTPTLTALTTWLELPGLGLLCANAFVLDGEQPVLVDTGVTASRDAFLPALRQVIDPARLRWVYLTHADPDHVGSVSAVLAAAPRARLVTTFLGMGKLGLLGHAVPPERVFLLNPGQSLDLGDRELVALRPPTYDAPETTAVFDRRERALFSADTFGAALSEATDDAAAVAAEALREGLVGWTTVDAPWLHRMPPRVLDEALEEVRRLAPEVILSAHLPPARGLTDRLLQWIRDARDAEPFVGPDQAAMEAMLAAV